MAFSGIEYAVLGDLKTIGQAAVSTSDVAAASHKIRELPKVGEVLDTLPCIIYCPHTALRSSAMGFESGSVLREYVEEVVVVFGREGDFASDQQQAMKVHEQLMRAFEVDPNTSTFRTTLPNVPTVWSVEIESAPNFDRSKLNDNYAYLSVVVRLKSAE